MNLLKKDFNTNRDSIPLEAQRKIFNELVKKGSSEFWNLERKINPDNLIYKYKTEGRSPKDFRNYQNLIKLFKHLRDCNVNPKEVLTNQTNFKSDLNEIRKGSPNLKSNLESNLEIEYL